MRAARLHAPSVPRFDLSLRLLDLAPARAGLTVTSGISLAMAPGEALVLRGANGAGKTSVLRAVAGLCAHGGTVSFAIRGAPLDPGEARARHTHLLGPRDGLAGPLSVAETGSFWAALLGGRAAAHAVGLSGTETTATGRLSTGQRRRLGLSRLLGSPRPLWLLDEPLSGLDEAGREQLLAAVAEHRAAGGLVLMASHETGLPDAAALRLS